MFNVLYFVFSCFFLIMATGIYIITPNKYVKGCVMLTIISLLLIGYFVTECQMECFMLAFLVNVGVFVCIYLGLKMHTYTSEKLYTIVIEPPISI